MVNNTVVKCAQTPHQKFVRGLKTCWQKWKIFLKKENLIYVNNFF